MTRGMRQGIQWGSAVAGIGVALFVAGTTVSLAQESVAVRALMVKGALPVDDPNAAAWNSAPQAQFPMSPQVHWQNRIQEVTVKDLKVRALHDGTQVAVLLEYADPTENPDDAAALEKAVRRALAESDMVVLSGGTSKGAGDLPHGVAAARQPAASPTT